MPGTLGPGATNLATDLADANLDRAPVVAITGKVSSDRMHKKSHQFVDVLKDLRPADKVEQAGGNRGHHPRGGQEGVQVAQEEKPGACLIELPEDVADDPAEEEPLHVERARRPSPDRASLARAADLTAPNVCTGGREVPREGRAQISLYDPVRDAID